MLGHGGLYKIPTKEEKRKLRGEEIRLSLLILDLNDGNHKMQDSKKKTRGSINCMFQG